MGTFVLIVLTMTFAPSSLAATTPIEWKYGVMFDAGSSSSKLKIYKWPARRSTLEVLDIDLILTKKYKPGISDFVKNLGDISVYLQQMLDKAKSTVPSELYSTTPCFLMATAGLRLLPESEAIGLMTSVRDFLNTSVNPFMFDPARVRILSGEEEGAYAWIAANYLMKFFGSNKPPSQAVGVLEMGGGSTQITFVPDGPLLANMFPVRMAGRQYNLYTHSYLYYGQNYMAYRINKYLFEQSPVAAELTNPCLLRGDSKTFIDGSTTRIVRGGSNPTKCLEIIDTFLHAASEDYCYPKPCAIGQVYQPSIGTDIFYAISAYVYAPKTLNSVDQFGRLEISKLNSSAFDYCLKNLVEVTNGSGIPTEFASSYCMMGLYIPALLTISYDFPVDTRGIYIADKINNEPVDWALGAVLYEIEKLDYKLWRNGCYSLASSSDAIHLNTFAWIHLFITLVITRTFVWL